MNSKKYIALIVLAANAMLLSAGSQAEPGAPRNSQLEYGLETGESSKSGMATGAALEQKESVIEKEAEVSATRKTIEASAVEKDTKERVAEKESEDAVTRQASEDPAIEIETGDAVVRETTEASSVEKGLEDAVTSEAREDPAIVYEPEDAATSKAAEVPSVEKVTDDPADEKSVEDPVIGINTHRQDHKKSYFLEALTSNWYIGTGLGSADTDASSNSYDKALAPGYTTRSDFSTTDLGWKIYGGYEFARNLSIEVAYVDLGEVTSDTIVNRPPGWVEQDFINAAANEHPYSLTGFTLSGKWPYIYDEGLAPFAKLGLFAWNAEIELECATCSNNTFDENGVDLTAGLGIDYDFAKHFSVRAEWEWFGTDRDDVSLLTVSLQYRQRVD